MSNGFAVSRRGLIGAGLALTVPLPAWADAGFVIDWQGGEQTPAVAESLAAQIALVERLAISDAAMAFFRSQVITVDLASDTKTRAGPRGIFFERRAVPAANPVLLHELIHRYQLERMPGGQRNADVHRFYDTAKREGQFRADSYMMTNAFEFFAMAASVVLYGRAERPPYARGNVKRRAPELYAFIVREFGFRD